MVKKHIVIFNWQFPPNTGIGGRRCALLAKEWKSMGHDITILTQAPPKEMNAASNDWISNQEMHQMHYVFIEKKNHFNARYFQKGIWNSMLLWVLKKWHSFFTEGNPIDDCRFSEKEIMLHLDTIHHQTPVDLLFVSSAPFSLSLYAAKFKILNPSVIVWCDFRDPWKNAVNYGLQVLKKRQRIAEEEFQKEVAQTCDFLSAPYTAILDEFLESGNPLQKVLIPHFTNRTFDGAPQIQTTNARPVFTYAGNLYDGAIQYILTGLKSLSNLPQTKQPLIHFIGHFSPGHQREMLDIYKHLQFTTWMNNGLDAHLSSSQGLIILLSPDNQHFHTSKFFDFLPLGKPYMYIGPKGDVYKTIIEHNLGCSIEQYNDAIFSTFDTNKANALAAEHTANKMALKILKHVHF